MKRLVGWLSDNREMIAAIVISCLVAVIATLYLIPAVLSSGMNTGIDLGKKLSKEEK